MISPAPSAFALRTAARASSGVAGKRFRFASGGSPSSHQPPFAVKIGAAGKTSGMSARVRESGGQLLRRRHVLRHQPHRRDAPGQHRPQVVVRLGVDVRVDQARHDPPALGRDDPRVLSAAPPAPPRSRRRPRRSGRPRRPAARWAGAARPSRRSSVAPRKAIVVASKMEPLSLRTAAATAAPTAGRERVLLLALLFLDLDGIDPRETGRAGRLLRAAERAQHSLHREIAEAVGLDVALDLLDGLVGRDQLAARGRVDAVVAGVHGRRRGDAHVHLARAGLPQHADDLARGRAAHDRVVDQHDALALDDLAHRVQLDLDAEVADRLLGLDERAPDVVVADEAEPEGDARLLRVARGPRTCRSRARG